MIAPAAIGSGAIPMLAFVPVAAVALWGLWLVMSSSARRSLLIERGGIELTGRLRLDQLLDLRLAHTQRGADLAARLRSAGTELTPARFLLLALGVTLGAFAFASLLFPLLLSVTAGALGGWGCFAWLGSRLDKRRDQFVAQLPEVARLLSNGSAAGLSMPAAMELAVKEIEAPASEELQTVIDELMFGRSLDESLERLQRRLPSREISVLMTTLIIQQRAGGDVVRALHDLSETLDARRETLREVKTVMAGAVYTSYIVPLLGLVSLFLLNTINSSTLDRMTSQPLGIAVLVIAGMAYGLGWFLIKRATRIEV